MTGWSELRETWPTGAGPEREAATVAAILRGDYVAPTWHSIELQAAGHTLRLQVAADALRLGAWGDSVRLISSHATQQRIADELGWVVPSAKIGDAIAVASSLFLDAADFTATAIWGGDTVGAPSSTNAMQQHSKAIDGSIPHGYDGLIAGPWKLWISSPLLKSPDALDPYGKDSGINYGLWSVHGPRQAISVPSIRVYQQSGDFHDAFHHSDYSQKFRPVKRTVHIKGPLYPAGQVVDVDTIANHPTLWKLVYQFGGPMKLRHPWLHNCRGGCPPPTKPPTPGPGPVDGEDPPALALPLTEPARGAVRVAVGLAALAAIGGAVYLETTWS